MSNEGLMAYYTLAVIAVGSVLFFIFEGAHMLWLRRNKKKEDRNVSGRS